MIRTSAKLLVVLRREPGIEASEARDGVDAARAKPLDFEKLETQIRASLER